MSEFTESARRLGEGLDAIGGKLEKLDLMLSIAILESKLHQLQVSIDKLNNRIDETQSKETAILKCEACGKTPAWPYFLNNPAMCTTNLCGDCYDKRKTKKEHLDMTGPVIGTGKPIEPKKVY